MKKSASCHRKSKPARVVGRDVESSSSSQAVPRGYVTIASIPGLARLIPGTHDPRNVINSAYGRWKLPVRFRGSEVALYRDGSLLARS